MEQQELLNAQLTLERLLPTISLLKSREHISTMDTMACRDQLGYTDR